MPFVLSHRRKIYYERHGSGPAVVFIHGAGSNAATWWQQLPAFSAQHTCITMDVRCFGRSVAPVEEFSLDLFTADVLAILDQQELEQAMVVGQSLGGMIGLQLALQHPARVAGFAACDTSLAIDHPELLRIVRERLTKVKAVSIEQRSLGGWFLENQPELAALYAQINHFNPSAHSIAPEAWSKAMLSLMEKGRLTPVDRLREVCCPTLFLVGSEDPIVPVHVMQEALGLVTGSELVIVPQAGHSTYFEMPQVFNREVLNFIQRRVSFA